MSHYDYADPGMDPERCDALSDPTPETCQDCHGDGWVYQHVDFAGHLERVTCPECDGRGYYEEER